MRVAKMATETAKGAGALIGIRNGTEEPPYDVQDRTQGLEVRRYGLRIAAETTVTGEEERARDTGFRRLAVYIFGSNENKTKIAMTAPVSQAEGSGDSSVVRFFMPWKWTMPALPSPVDSSVDLVEVPGETLAVLRFAGDRGPGAVAERTAELLRKLEAGAWTVTGQPVAWFYDPPWTLPFRRRNEVAVPVTRR